MPMLGVHKSRNDALYDIVPVYKSCDDAYTLENLIYHPIHDVQGLQL